MIQGKVGVAVGRLGGLLERRWRLVTLLAWLILAGWFVYSRWAGIQAFALGDTDDNLRMAQVRALLSGQDWFDLRQYRLNPPLGADIHWSRLVDLPIAAIKVLLQPLLGGAAAEKVAVAAAPLLPLLVLLFGMALTVRRLVDARAYPLAFIALFFAGSTSGMFMPTRIDHHGWQLAILSLIVAGLADRRRARGGITAGAATALSLAIGLELLIYLAIAGSAIVLFWIVDRDQRERAGPYAVTVAGGTALAYLLFASYANRSPVCDALSPVWLSNALLGGALLFAASRLSPQSWPRRLALAAAIGALLALFHASAWPHCLTRLEGVSPEVERLWLSKVREARPIYLHKADIMAAMLAIPVTGIVGWALLAWRNRRDDDLFRRTIAAAAPALAALLLLFWQTRTGPAAQMMGTMGCAALVWVAASALLRSRLPIAAKLGAAAAVLVVGVGAAVPLVHKLLPRDPPSARDLAIGRANRMCASMAALRAVALQPRGMVFSFVDYGPRLITVTHHNAVTGPYHRNGEQIADVMTAFRGSAEQARRIMAKYRSDYLLVCPNSSTTTIFLAEAPRGFYAQLNKGQVPNWLQPIELPENSPFRMWRVKS